MSDFIVGGWTQNPANKPFPGFSHTMYGMITNLDGLTTGTADAPGWSPEKTSAPNISPGVAMWTYGGGLCSPDAMPATSEQVQRIIDCTEQKQWAGVDFDDECHMNIDNLIESMQRLRPLQSSYTFLAGWDYNNPSASDFGKEINNAVLNVSNANAADRFALMCYASAMWSEQDIKNNVSQAIDRTININGVDKKQVILALTPAGLTDWNLNYFLDQVEEFDIGGLYIWDFTSLKAEDYFTITNRLGINLG